MDEKYLLRRKKNLFSRYKLLKRCEVIYELLKKYTDGRNFRILDVGCCDGKMLSYIKDRIPESECYGIEPEEKFLLHGNDKRIKLFRGKAEQLCFPDEHFDFVIASSVAEHVEEPDKMFSEIYRVLKPNGKFIWLFVVPFYEKLAVMLKVKKDDHYRNYSMQDALKILYMHGLKDIEYRRLPLLFYQVLVATKIKK